MKYVLFTVLLTVFVAQSLKRQSVASLISKAEKRLNHDDWVGAISDLKKKSEKKH